MNRYVRTEGHFYRGSEGGSIESRLISCNSNFARDFSKENALPGNTVRRQNPWNFKESWNKQVCQIKVIQTHESSDYKNCSEQLV